MDRSLAALLGRPLHLAARKPRRARPAAGAGRRSRARRARGHHGRLAPAGGRPVRVLMAPVSALAAHRRMRLALTCLAAVALVLAGAWTWLRHSSLAAVRQVRVSGVRGPEARQIDAALVSAARRMNTLGVDVAALRAAVRPFPIVREVRAAASFPHKLRVTVVEQPPVAALSYGSWRTAAAADGPVLGQALLRGSLPTLAAARVLPQGANVHDARLAASLRVLGAAPAPLLKAVARVYTGPRGLTVAMRNGLLVFFGEAGRPHAKWIALIRVLSDRGSAGASYVDVRLPERPAAGFPPGVTRPAAAAAGPEGESGESGESAEAPASSASSRQEGTIEALASALGRAAGVNSPGEEEQGESGAAKGEGSAESSGEASGESESGSSESGGEAEASG
jgi:cell division protein FtsQ